MRNRTEIKNNRPRRSIFLVAAAAALIALVGCSSAAGATGASGQSDLLQTILKRGTINIGECMGNAPYGFYSASNQPEGFDIDIADQLGQALGVKVNIVNVSPAARIPSLQTGKVDVVFCNTTRTVQRAEQVSFTNTYNVQASVIFSKAGSGIESLSDLAGKTVATTKGTPYAQVIESAAPSAKVIQFDTPADDVTAVKQGQATAAVEDAGFLDYEAKQSPGYQVSTKSVVPLYYNSFAIEQGQPNLLAVLNEFLFELNTSGEYKTLYKKWFGINPPYQLNPTY